LARVGEAVVGTRAQLDAEVAEVAARSGRVAHVVGEVGADRITLPDAADLLHLAATRFTRGETVAPEALRPEYLRDADVRIGWAERGGGRVPGPVSPA
jgi:tRNA A37 threonylcarbamoyladenosine modification protein TsaB